MNMEARYGRTLDTGPSANGNEIVPTRFDEEEGEEESIDTSHFGLQEMEMMQNRDPFMYHSIVQEIRKRNLSAFNSSEEDVDDGNDDEEQEELGGQGLQSPDAAARNAQSNLYHGNTFVANDSNSFTQGSITSQDRVSSSAGQQRRQSQSHRVPATSSRHQRRFSQSFSSFSTGIVKRKRRISVESTHSLEMAELASSIRSSVTSDISDLDRIFGLDNVDTDQNDLSLSAMTLDG